MLLKIEELIMRARMYSSQALERIESKYGRLDRKERRELTHQLEIAYLNGAKDMYQELPRLSGDTLAA